MKTKMKKCLNCKTLLSNSSKVCTKCGSKELEKGLYTDESNKSIIYNKYSDESRNEVMCPICSAWVTIKKGHGECCFCGEEISIINNIIL